MELLQGLGKFNPLDSSSKILKISEKHSEIKIASFCIEIS